MNFIYITVFSLTFRLSTTLLVYGTEVQNMMLHAELNVQYIGMIMFVRNIALASAFFIG